MKFTSAIVLASAAFTSAQVTSNPDGSFTCAIPDAAYCDGDSLGTNIIIRCIGTVGHPGNCNDNLSGEFPQGVNFAPCFQTSKTSGDAACSKNCIVYEGSGSGKQNGTFTLPSCTPQTPPPTSTVILSYSVNTATTTHLQASTFSTTQSTTTSTPPVAPISTGTGITGTRTTGYIGNYSIPTGGSGGSGSVPVTIPTNSATATPKSPSSPAPVSFTGGATIYSAGTILATIGIIFAYFL